MRHVPASEGTWHPAADMLSGSHPPYGSSADPTKPWSIKFDHIDFNQFMFATGDFQLWLKMSSKELLGDEYRDKPRKVIQSSLNPNPSKIRMSNVAGQDYGPYVALKDWKLCSAGQNCVLYYANGSTNAAYLGSVRLHDGADVYIRRNVDIDNVEAKEAPKLITPPILSLCQPTSTFLIG